MVELLPRYPTNIIVGTLCNNIFSWYVTERDPWFLNLYILRDAYEKKFGSDIDSYNPLNDPAYIRYGFPILDKKAFEVFQGRLNKYRCFAAELKEWIPLIREDDDALEGRCFAMWPSLYINFDSNIIYNCYYEPEAFEAYLPEGWTGVYEDFRDLIPVEQQYWVGENLF
jgi:hypothetical protein